MISLLLLSLGDQPRSFHPRPWTQARERGLDVAGNRQPLDRGIDPTFNRNIGRRHVGGVAVSVSTPWLSKVRLGIAMRVA